MSKLVDMTGQKCGKLVVIERAPNNKNGRAMWKCKCDCGNEVIVQGKSLRSGHSKSCGHCGRPNLIVNEIGNRYGKLVVIEQVNSIQGRAAWKCLCDCGNICIATGQNLRQMKYQSCGCLNSKGEEIVRKLLTANHIPFERQKTFDSCRFSDSGALARFDFFIDKNYIIEYDGVQHFNYDSGWNTKEKFIITQDHDKFKNEWCKENNIPLIRIPYTYLNNLTIEDLMLETSRFVV